MPHASHVTHTHDTHVSGSPYIILLLHTCDATASATARFVCVCVCGRARSLASDNHMQMRRINQTRLVLGYVAAGGPG